MQERQPTNPDSAGFSSKDLKTFPDNAYDSPRIQKPGAQDHDRLARALLQLHLDGAELAMDDADHPLDLLRRDGPGPALFSKEVHHVGGEFIACLQWQHGGHG